MRETNEVRMQRANRLCSVMQKVKEKCDNGDFYGKGETIKHYLYNNRFTNTCYLTALKELGLTYRDENNIPRWKKNVPVTKRLALTIMEKTTEISNRHNNRKPKKQVITQTQQLKQRGGKRPNAGRKTKQQEIKNYLPQVGLIRKFLRWLY
jgi:hypothetical protein